MLKKLKKLTGGGKVDKMWAGTLAPVLIEAAVKIVEGILDITIDPAINLALIALATGGAVYRVPNKS